MKPVVRNILLGSMFLATTVAALWPTTDDVDHGRTTPYAARQATTSGAALANARSIALPALRPLVATNTTQPGESKVKTEAIIASDLFPPQTWVPPPAPSQSAAPALPFGFGGRYVEAGRIVVFLTEGERMHSMRVGETINGNYRLDAIEAQMLHLTYLPLNIRQSLYMGPMIP